MNAKTIYWIIAISAVCIGAVIVSKYYQQESELSTRELCFAGSIDACVTLDKTNKRLYQELEVTQQQIAENNKAIKEQAGKLLSGSSFQ